jgi:hypothetical protein
MRKNHESNVANSDHSRNPFSVRFLTLVLMATLCLVSLQSNASAQTCWEMCQVALTSCMQAAQGDPIQEVRCQDLYDKCGLDCQ